MRDDPLDALEISLRRLRVMLCIGYGIAAVQSGSGSAFQLRPMLAVGAVVLSLAAANAYGLLVDHRPSERRVVTAIYVQLGLDTLAGGVASVMLLAHDDGLRWLPLLFPVFEAGLRFRLRGLGLMWGLVTVLSLASEFATRPALDPQGFLTGASLVLVIAAPASYLSQLLFEELREQVAIRHDAERREERATQLAAELSSLQAQLHHDATHDALTGILNRAGFEDAVVAAAATSDPSSVMGLVFCDLDEFKLVNDRLGHRTGDRVLVEVARRLLASVAQLGGVPARLGGDEFVVLLDGVTGEEEIAERVALLQQVLDWPYGFVPADIGFGASVGWTTFAPNHAGAIHDVIDDALAAADERMYASKERRRGRRIA